MTVIEFRVLGPVEVRVDGELVDLGPPKQRVVLAALLADAGRPVSIETLVNRVWDDAPPEKARTVLYAHITRIRRALRSAGTPHPRVVHRSDGYVLEVHPDLVDLHRFRRLVGQARDRGTTGEDRVALLREAQRLWRGTPLAGLPGEWSGRVREAAEQQRLGAVLAWAEAERRLGHHQPVIDQLGDVIADHPLAEPLVAELMRALRGAERSAEALAVYAAARERLAAELGTEPGPDLRHLHEQILGRHASSPHAHGVRQAGPPVVPAPRQLPADVATFTGRIAELDRLLSPGGGNAPAGSESPPDPAVAVHAIDGMAGVGKTALAVHAAHRLAPRYPDGQLFVDLHGHTPGLPPTEPAAALDHMLRSLGVPGERIPDAVEERAALFRSRLAGRRVLLVLDNAADEAQVDPLLPGTAGCLVLVTSRARLTGLDAAALSLETLPLADAAALLTRGVGADRLAGSGIGAAEAIAALCGRLPLAIRIAAARLRHRPLWSADQLAELLRDERGRLHELEAGRHSVAATLHLSCEQLTGEQQRMFRYLSLHPGPDVEPHAAAALARTTVERARRLLESLLDANLLSQRAPGRYAFHDLVRAHAREEAQHGCSESDRYAALTRLLEHYAHTAAAAVNAVHPADAGQRPRVGRPGTATPDVGTPEAAEHWLGAELGNLLASAAHAATHGRPAHTVFLSATLHPYLYTRARYRDAETLHQRASAVARVTRDRAGEQDALNGLGAVHYVRGRFERAADCFGRALDIARASGSRTGEQAALRGLGNVDYAQGRFDQAAEHFGLALAIARDTGNRAGELNALGGLGHVYRARGHFERAADHLDQALRIARDTGNIAGEQNALRSLGDVHRVLGRFELATEHAERALDIARDTGNRAGELYALCGLAAVHRVLGRFERATEHAERALDIARDIGYRAGEQYALYGLGCVHLARGGYAKAAECFGRMLDIARDLDDRDGQFEAYHGLGRARHAAGRHQQALTDHHTALDLATAVGQPADVARAHDALARTHGALGRHAEARHHWRAALDVLVSHGVDHTDDPEVTATALRAHLADLDSDRAPSP